MGMAVGSGEVTVAEDGATDVFELSSETKALASVPTLDREGADPAVYKIGGSDDVRKNGQAKAAAVKTVRQTVSSFQNSSSRGRFRPRFFAA